MLRKDLKKKAEQFRKAATPEERLRLADAGRQERNWVLGGPEKAPGLAFLDRWFETEVKKPHTELADIAQAWEKEAPDHAKAAQLLSFKRGTLEVAVASSAMKYKLEMDLRTGFEQRLRAAHRGGTLKKVKIVLQTEASSKPISNPDLEGTEELRRTGVSEAFKAAEKGQL